jgi:ArsR family transcriptional regulator, lead/cadmium/zinc/bismuth-responsive transcriptional repressor
MDSIQISEAEELADFCGILGNSHRIRIVWALGDRELTVSEIADEIEASMQNTSQHLRLMKNKGVLQSRRDGREIYYRIADTKFTRTCPVISRNR